jgi:Mg-chelatase subunit ChlD
MNKTVPLALLLCLILWAMMPATGAPQQSTNAGQGNSTPAPPPAVSAPEDSTVPENPPLNQPGDTVEVPQQGQSPDSQEGGVFVFKKEVEEVTLHATVVDDRQHPVTNLNRADFVVFENGQPQKITSFRQGDVPVALGILVDNSGSMRDKRPAVNQAALNLVRASNPKDQVFIVNFNQTPYLDQDYTDNINLLKDALNHLDSRGGTALYDAVVASADHLTKTAPPDQKKVLLVVTDGEDTASMDTLEQAVRKVAVDGGPTIYTIGILGSEREKRVAFFPKDLTEVDEISRQVAHDIRNQYIIGYKPSNPQRAGGYRTVKVEVHSTVYKRLQVRTRSGYYANDARRAAR